MTGPCEVTYHLGPWFHQDVLLSGKSMLVSDSDSSLTSQHMGKLLSLCHFGFLIFRAGILPLRVAVRMVLRHTGKCLPKSLCRW